LIYYYNCDTKKYIFFNGVLALAKNTKLTTGALIDKALNNHAKGRKSQAMEFFKSVLERESNNVIALYMIGAMHSEDGLYEDALDYLNKAIDSNDKFAQSYQARSIIYYKLGYYKLAFEDAEKALRIDPQLEETLKNYETLRILAEDNYLQKKKTTSSTTISVLNIVDLIDQSNHAITEKQKEHSIRSFQNFLIHGDKRQYHLALFSIGVLYHKINRNQDAEAYFRQALLVKHDFFICHLNLGLLLEHTNRAQEAVAQWELALKIPAINLPENGDDKLKITTNLGRFL